MRRSAGENLFPRSSITPLPQRSTSPRLSRVCHSGRSAAARAVINDPKFTVS
jgi:hypothetical protein